MKPLNTQILIKYVEEQEKKTESGIYVPPSANTVTATDFLKQGEVLEVNPDEKNIKVGDQILFNYHSKVKVPGSTDLILVRSEDVYMIK